MNQWDQDNLKFLLTADAKTMQDWHRHATPDDYNYAMELLQAAQAELTLQELDYIDQEANEDVSDAQAVLAKFRL